MRISMLSQCGRMTIRLVMIGLLAYAGLLMSAQPSQAGWHDHYYGRHGWGWVPFPIPYPYPYPYAYPYDYYPPTYVYPAPVTVVPQAPAVIVPQAAPPQAQAPTAGPDSYYYCTKPKGYYPYVPKCKVDWKLVPITPPSGRVGP